MIHSLIDAMEMGLIPDSLVRIGIRQVCRNRIKEIKCDSLELKQQRAQAYLESLISSPLAIHTDQANQQHYELPSDFFSKVLGKNKKYSCCYYSNNILTLDEAEDEALRISCERAGLVDGMKILDLGCGWGSLSLYMAQRFPQSQIVAISNSTSQKKYIDEQSKLRNLQNLKVVTHDISKLENLSVGFEKFDRVMSIEMFEHFKNYQILLKRISNVLEANGKLFIHVFSHREYAYPFETQGEDDWMAKYFFTGGQMPSHQLFYSFQDDLELKKSWAWDGTHYQKTSEDWLKNMDKNINDIEAIFKKTYGQDYRKWIHRWRAFFMACAEMFGYDQGQLWGVSHYLFSQRN